MALKKIFGDFADISSRPEVGVLDQAIILGTEDRIPALKTLQEDERIIVVEWGELRAEATATRREAHGRTFWLAHELGEILDDVPATPVEETISARGRREP